MSIHNLIARLSSSLLSHVLISGNLSIWKPQKCILQIIGHDTIFYLYYLTGFLKLQLFICLYGTLKVDALFVSA